MIFTVFYYSIKFYYIAHYGGHKMKNKVTMKQIAERLGVSINTVSLVLNDKAGVGEETRLAVLRIAEETGYLEQNEQYNKAYSSKNICVLMRRAYFNDMYFYSKVLYGIQNQAKHEGFDVIVYYADELSGVPSCVEKRKVAGIIIVGRVEQEKIKMLRPYNLPITFVDDTPFDEPTDSILTDNKLGAYQAVHQLIQWGYKNIGFFGDLNYSLSIKERYWGYLEALIQSGNFGGIKEVFNHALRFSILEDIEESILKQDETKILEIVKKIPELPQAFFCSNDRAAIMLSNALRSLGYSLPQDIGIVGFDDLDLATMVLPKLTTVRVSTKTMGATAANLLLSRIQNRKRPIEKVLLPVKLIVRDSALPVNLPE